MTKLSFSRFKRQVAVLLRDHLAITIDDCTDEEVLKACYENNEAPDQFVDWIGKKYDLDRIDQFPYSGSPTGRPSPSVPFIPTCNSCGRIVEHEDCLTRAGYCAMCAKEAGHPPPLSIKLRRLYEERHEARRNRRPRR